MELLTRDQLAEYLRLKPSTVQTQAKNKRWDMIPPPIKVGNRNRWDKDRVDDWLRGKQICFLSVSGTERSRNARQHKAQH